MSNELTLRDIASDWLKSHGYDGFWNRYCGCALGDLMCCDEPQPDCTPGYLHACGPDCEDCEGHGCIKPEKPKKPESQGGPP